MASSQSGQLQGPAHKSLLYLHHLWLGSGSKANFAVTVLDNAHLIQPTTFEQTLNLVAKALVDFQIQAAAWFELLHGIGGYRLIKSGCGLRSKHIALKETHFDLQSGSILAGDDEGVTRHVEGINLSELQRPRQ